MKVRVTYSNDFDQESLDCLAAYSGRRLSRDEIRQLLIDLGRIGIDEQIVEGRSRLEHAARHGSS